MAHKLKSFFMKLSSPSFVGCNMKKVKSHNEHLLQALMLNLQFEYKSMNVSVAFSSVTKREFSTNSKVSDTNVDAFMGHSRSTLSIH